jgi:hypothetical protein
MICFFFFPTFLAMNYVSQCQLKFPWALKSETITNFIYPDIKYTLVLIRFNFNIKFDLNTFEIILIHKVSVEMTKSQRHVIQNRTCIE